MNFPHPGPGGLSGLRGTASLLAQGFFFILMLAVCIGLIVLLVRFLLVATKAARLYVDKNSAAPAVSTAPKATIAAPTAAATTKVTPTRAPKAPPKS